MPRTSQRLKVQESHHSGHPNYIESGPAFVHRKLIDEWRSYLLRWGGCERCPLHHTSTLHVLGRGTLPCEVLFLGEGPGKSEDLTGVPFTGPAGYKPGGLESLLEDSFRRFRPYSYFISNVVACRPNDFYQMSRRESINGTFQEITDYIPNDKDRAPTQTEADACHPRVVSLIRMARPTFLVLLGRVAQQYINPEAIAKELKRDSLPVVSLYHPSYIVRGQGKNSSDYARSVLLLSNALHQHLSKEPPE